MWAKELEERSKKIQELGEEELKQEVAEESVVSDDWDKAVHSIRNRVVMVEQMVTSQLVGFVRTVLRVRNCLVEREGQEGVDTMLSMASTILKSMGRSTDY